MYACAGKQAGRQAGRQTDRPVLVPVGDKRVRLWKPRNRAPRLGPNAKDVVQTPAWTEIPLTVEHEPVVVVHFVERRFHALLIDHRGEERADRDLTGRHLEREGSRVGEDDLALPLALFSIVVTVFTVTTDIFALGDFAFWGRLYTVTTTYMGPDDG